MIRPSVVVVACVCLTACGEEPVSITTGGVRTDGERWGDLDTPHKLTPEHNFEVRLLDLPRSGEAARTPWPGSHWPTFLDSINHRWRDAGELSPVEKYERAFGGQGLEDSLSRVTGLDVDKHKPCHQDSECSAASFCAKRRGKAEGRCVEEWYGICDGWAAASVSVPEPRRAVRRNGVTFRVNDIKALVSYAYKTAPANHVGLRCWNTPTFDAHGRPTEARCRDTNPGTYHILLANLLGRQHRPFIIDGDMGTRVFNYPVFAFKVQSMRTLQEPEAVYLLNLDRTGSPREYNEDARSWVYVENHVRHVTDPDSSLDGPLVPDIETHTATMKLEYILELDRHGNIIGGEWVGPSTRAHPDFVWIPHGAPTNPQPFAWSILESLVMSAAQR